MAEAHPHPLDNSVPSSSEVRQYWQAFCKAARLPATTPYQAWYFGDTPAMAHELAELVLHGPKRATAGLAEFNDQMPQVKPVAGGYSVLTGFDGTPRAVIRTTRLDRRPLRDVDAAFAWDEGEGDRTLADWQRGHRAFFTRELQRMGRAFDDAMPVDLERFELLYPLAEALNPVACGPRVLPALLPGTLSASTAIQTAYYCGHHDFSLFFESERMADVARFIERYDPERDGVFIVVDGGRVLGSMVVDGGASADPDCAELRWFILHESLRGRGLGARLMQAAMDFAASRYARVELGTFTALADARRLYESFGFRLLKSFDTTQWGPPIVEQEWEWRKEPA